VLKEHARLGSWDPASGVAVVTLDDPGQEFFLRPRLEALQETLRQLTSPRARLELRSLETKPARAPIESDQARNVKKEALEHPLVRGALEIFDGEVAEVRALKP
jgi:hypothetical protein